MKDLLTPKYLIRFAVIVAGLYLLTRSITLSLGILCLLIAADRIAELWNKRKEETEQEEEE